MNFIRDEKRDENKTRMINCFSGKQILGTKKSKTFIKVILAVTCLEIF